MYVICVSKRNFYATQLSFNTSQSSVCFWVQFILKSVTITSARVVLRVGSPSCDGLSFSGVISVLWIKDEENWKLSRSILSLRSHIANPFYLLMILCLDARNLFSKADGSLIPSEAGEERTSRGRDIRFSWSGMIRTAIKFNC